jgi:hypothetical protein
LRNSPRLSFVLASVSGFFIVWAFLLRFLFPATHIVKGLPRL